MPVLTRSELAAYAVCALVIALLGWRALQSSRVDVAAGGERVAVGRQSIAPTGPTGATGEGGGDVFVHVVGAVRRPGLYGMRAGARVNDAIRRAGGATARADLAGVNLAAKVADAQQVVVPRRGSRVVAAAGEAAGSAAAGAPAGAGPAVGPIDLNSATVEQLDTLDGVGPVIARKIIEHRTSHGPFRSVDDLGQVPGIGPKRLAALRAHVRV